MRWVIGIVALVVVIGVLAGGWCLYEGVTASLHAEHVLHAALLSVQLLDDYVTQHGGDWPSSWADLEKLPPREWAMFQWPEDSAEVQRYVTVDFAANLDTLATQSADEFDAVKPIGPYYKFNDHGSVERLLTKVREFRASGETDPR